MLRIGLLVKGPKYLHSLLLDPPQILTGSSVKFPWTVQPPGFGCVWITIFKNYKSLFLASCIWLYLETLNWKNSTIVDAHSLVDSDIFGQKLQLRTDQAILPHYLFPVGKRKKNNNKNYILTSGHPARDAAPAANSFRDIRNSSELNSSV